MEAIGKLNRYICKDCARQVYTVNLNTGVTPFGVTCPHCGGDNCYSNFYRIGPVPPQTEVTVTHCFYRPTKERLDVLNLAAVDQLKAAGLPGKIKADVWDDHVLVGGLVFDVLGRCEPVPESGPPPFDDFEAFQVWVEARYGRRMKRPEWFLPPSKGAP